MFKELEQYKHVLTNIAITPIGLIKLKGINHEVEVNFPLHSHLTSQVVQILPLSLSKRKFPANNEDYSSRFTNQIVLHQVEKLANENEQLKKQIVLLEDRLNQLDAEAKVFAEKLSELKTQKYHKKCNLLISLLPFCSCQYWQLQKGNKDINKLQFVLP